MSNNLSNADWIRQKIEHAFPEATFRVSDTRGDDMHLALSIRSKVFEGKTMVQSHRMIYDCLESLRCGLIHALSIQTRS